MKVSEDWYNNYKKKRAGKLTQPPEPTKKGKFQGIKKVAGEMNQTEARYVTDYLKPLKLVGEIEEYYYEAIKLKLDDGSWYCPDFFVVYPDCIGFHEVKGSYKLDGVGHSKFKQAMNKHPYFRWIMVKWKGKKEGWETVHDNVGEAQNG